MAKPVNLTAVFLCNLWFHLNSAHVALNFPKARMYDLDFLDNIHTKTPCGMPKGWIKTTIPSGMLMNFTWSMAYPHRGGYRLELWNGNQNNLLANLTALEPGKEYVSGNPTAQSHVVQIPEITCSDCIVRLVRQAIEFGETYVYQSCADVNIVDKRMFRNTCFGRGMPNGNHCYCYKGFSGPLCQYEEECDTDIDCSGRGVCVHIGGTNHPSRQCFCAPGFHGEKCSMTNMAILPSHQTLDHSMYKMKMLNDKISFYYRMIPASIEQLKEIEFVMEVMGTSFAALGMRPKSFDESCKQFPVIDEPMKGSFMSLNQNWMTKSQRLSGNHSQSRNVRMVNNGMTNQYGHRQLRETAYTPVKGTFHPMDCCDITIGAARGMFSRIRDYYTRDQSTPRLDEMWGGWDDISSATGWEMNGKTTLIFRKKMWAMEQADHSISGDMHVIWSRGQEPGMYVHAVPSGLETEGEMPMNKLFYTPDEIKYHGHGMQRGVIESINFAA